MPTATNRVRPTICKEPLTIEMHPHVPLLAFYLLPLPTLTKLSRLSCESFTKQELMCGSMFMTNVASCMRVLLWKDPWGMVEGSDPTVLSTIYGGVE